MERSFTSSVCFIILFLFLLLLVSAALASTLSRRKIREGRRKEEGRKGVGGRGRRFRQ
jgi:hypothetical protein